MFIYKYFAFINCPSILQPQKCVALTTSTNTYFLLVQNFSKITAVAVVLLFFLVIKKDSFIYVQQILTLRNMFMTQLFQSLLLDKSNLHMDVNW